MIKRRDFLELLAGTCLSLSVSSRVIATADMAATGTGLIYDPFYLEHRLFQGHPESPQRLVAVMDRLRAAGLGGRLQHLPPLAAVEPELYRIHSREHVNSIRERHGHSHTVAVAVVGGVLAAVDAVCTGKLKNTFCATRPPGHHATNTGEVEGFCFYNAVAIAARYAQQRHGLGKILVVDWDYHHGNGTEAAFYSDPDVLFFSTHDYYAYPGTGDPARRGSGAGKGFNINVHLDCGAEDRDIIRAFEQHLLPAVHSFKPELVLISAGFDSRKGDRLGCFEVTDEGFVRLTEMVMALASRYCNGRIVSVLEGGYTPSGLASSVEAHVRTLLAG